MEAGRVGDPGDPRTRRVQGHRAALLPAVGLSSANASGKSNLRSARAFMCSAVIASHRFWPPEGGVPRDPFAWGSANAAPSLFELTLVLGGTRYHRCRKQSWFEREGDTFSFGGHLPVESRVAQAFTHTNALVLSAAVQHRSPLLALQILRPFNSPGSNPRGAQILFTTHHTILLGTTTGAPALRRDQIWLREKDERGYLQGRYGANPFLGDLLPLEESG